MKHQVGRIAASSRPGRAAVLIRRMCEAGVSREAIAAELHVADATLDAYESGVEPIPLNHQARLALFVIATVPALTREGNQLRGQVAAAIAFQTRETDTSRQAPSSGKWFSSVDRDAR